MKHTNSDPRDQSGHRTFERISASIPQPIVAEMRKRVGKRGLSQFVARAIARELLDMNRADYLAECERLGGPLDPAELAEAFRMLES
jgi:hypothetical protein